VWNRALPPDILIRDVQVVDEAIHPQHAVVAKTYWYHIATERPLPWFARYAWNYQHAIDENKLRACLELCVGTHNFRSFCTGDYVDRSTVRTIHHITLVPLPRYNGIRIVVQGPGFLYLMVRRIVGSALYIASHPKMSVELFQEIFLAHSPAHHLPTAPAHGLMLRKIEYEWSKAKETHDTPPSVAQE